jgi:hypothetical protein
MSDEHVEVKFDGKVVGWADIDENGNVSNAALSAEGLKHVLPDYDPTAGLSIGFAETPERPYVLPEHMDFDTVEDITFPARRKGTFDA